MNEFSKSQWKTHFSARRSDCYFFARCYADLLTFAVIQLFFLEGNDMFFGFLVRRKSSVASCAVQLESLESRQLLSASSIDADVLGLDGSATNQDVVPMNFVAESTQPVKVEGTFVGHYQSAHYGKSTLTFVITHDTHTGHFTGTVDITRLGTANVKGVVGTNHHIDVSFDSSGESGIFTGTASHTGGSFYGSYTVSGAVNDTGTYHVGKS